MSKLTRASAFVACFLTVACGDDTTAPLPDLVVHGGRRAAASALPTVEWQQLATAGTSPSARYIWSAAMDQANDRVIVYGGLADWVLDEVWVLANASGTLGVPTWSRLAPVGGPPAARSNHTTVYDAATNRLIMHGGCLGLCSPVAFDTWVLTHANGVGGTPEWIRLPSAPLGRAQHTAVYDAATNRMIVFGGITGFFNTARNDTWVLHNANGVGFPVWTQVTPAGALPGPRDAAPAIFDPASGRMVVFGGQRFFSGFSGISYDDLWALDGATRGGSPTWTLLTPDGAGPSARAMSVFVYDTERNRAVVYAGVRELPTPGGLFSELWLLENANGIGGPPEWHLMDAATAPGGRYRAFGGYSTAAGGLVTGYGAKADVLPTDLWLLRIQDVVDVRIDVKPGSERNPINPRSRGVTPVALLAGPELDLGAVDRATIRFGANGTEAAPQHATLEDVDGDGDLDLLLQFRTEATGIHCGVGRAHLRGKTSDGRSFRGSDTIMTIGC